MPRRYRVALLNGNDEPELWLTETLHTTNCAWDAGAFPKVEADGLAAWARKHIRRGLELCRWTVEPVTPAEHYGALRDGANAGTEIGGDAA